MEERSSYPPPSAFAKSPDAPPPMAAPRAPRVRAMGPGKVTMVVLLALGVAVVGAWATLIAYAGRQYGLAVDSAPDWQQTTYRIALHLVPGAAAVLSGLVLLLTVPGLRRGRRRFLGGLAALLAIAAGTWLILGRGALAAYTGLANVDTMPGSPAIAFLLRAAFESGPGVLLLVFGAWSLGLQAVGRIRDRTEPPR
jgi:hypothetical protein